ncbi:MAG: RNA polymerase sigma factor SigZ [Ignavibacteriae bacterium]|nr:RNA polymerase sigma factor SigZ [Ignavibacteriota bacterium]MCI0707936.1 RNA polymerase sigma factor SigZ [Ignavibacteriota bacterium]
MAEILATEQIWETFHQDLHSFIRRRVKDEDMSKDILQDVFLKIHLKAHTLRESDRLAGWVYQITRNSMLDYFRSRKNSTVLPDILPELPDEKAEDNYNREIAECVKPMIDRLPELYREALLHTELGDLSQKEYAQKIGISYTGAKSRVQRARALLVQLLDECCRIEADTYGNLIEVEAKSACC